MFSDSQRDREVSALVEVVKKTHASYGLELSPLQAKTIAEYMHKQGTRVLGKGGGFAAAVRIMRGED